MLDTVPASQTGGDHPSPAHDLFGSPRLANALTIDVEDYFQVSAFERTISPVDWPGFDSRVCRNTERLLEILEETGTRGTFFVLGWVAAKFPELVRQVHLRGHEIASHGYWHRLVYAGTRDEFRDDLRRAKDAIESAAGVAVIGYRAPSFSITRDSLWALDVLIEEGYAFDASIFPVNHDRYGIPDWPRHAQLLERHGGQIWEVPPSTVRLARHNLPIGGGGYFRLLPYSWTRLGIARLNNVEGRPAVFYLHPWEIDPAQPRIPASLFTTFRHYRNLDKTSDRLGRLLREFRFGTISEMLGLSSEEGAKLTGH